MIMTFASVLLAGDGMKIYYSVSCKDMNPGVSFEIHKGVAPAYRGWLKLNGKHISKLSVLSASEKAFVLGDEGDPNNGSSFKLEVGRSGRVRVKANGADTKGELFCNGDFEEHRVHL